MKISGFTIARGAVTFGYPLKESVQSLLPLVDEMVIGVGDMEDGTWELLEGLQDPKIKLFRSTWDMSQREGGKVLSVETNKALERIRGDWGVYLQADELLHESELPRLRQAMEKHLLKATEALEFDYLHFYGSFSTVQDHRRKWYRHGVRAIKNGLGIRSVGDAYGFRRFRGQVGLSLRRANCAVTVYHYGWVRPPEVMMEKQKNLDRMYHDEAWIQAHYEKENAKVLEFYRDRGHLKFFKASHPQAILAKVAAQDWSFEHGIEKQWPDLLRHLYVLLLYPIEKRLKRWFKP
jgi:glycosyltransferase involved in cell wall biosynthesis